MLIPTYIPRFLIESQVLINFNLVPFRDPNVKPHNGMLCNQHLLTLII